MNEFFNEFIENVSNSSCNKHKVLFSFDVSFMALNKKHKTLNETKKFEWVR